MSRQVLKALENVEPGALVCCSWCDASIGKSRTNRGVIDVPVKSWGVFLGLIGTKIKHIVLAQNSFKYAEGFFDLDYTAIPLGLATDIHIIEEQCIQKEIVDDLIESFMISKTRVLRRSTQPRVLYRQQHRRGL
ncbi:MAG TPA: hypothetical protein VI864_02590 [Candidatus Bathyarchaeia archaeon]|nr:hypothetical protein [Candidatus Bathyarchaeia archaeon]